MINKLNTDQKKADTNSHRNKWSVKTPTTADNAGTNFPTTSGR